MSKELASELEPSDVPWIPRIIAADSKINPPHYQQNGFETIDVIEAWDLNFRLANVVKYISRAGKKDDTTYLEDLQKAMWYLDREIKRLMG